MLVTTDNAGNMKKAIKKLGKFKWLGCFGHTLNLAIKRALKNATLPMVENHTTSDDSDESEFENRDVNCTKIT